MPIDVILTALAGVVTVVIALLVRSIVKERKHSTALNDSDACMHWRLLLDAETQSVWVCAQCDKHFLCRTTRDD